MQQGIQIRNQRDKFADFLKYILIYFVILGHFINLYQYSRGFGGLFNCIYSFHMPLFVFISGYFSKRLNSYRKKNIDTLLYPFFLFQLINILYTVIVPIEPLNGNLFYPYHQNWYLIALFWWRTFIPYKQFFKEKVVVVLSVLISLGIGFFPEWNMFLGLYKTAYFLPFFVLGSYCEDLSKLLDRLMRHRVLWIVFFCIIMSLLVIVSFDSNCLSVINYGFCARVGYEGEWTNVIVRTISLCVSLLTCCSVLVVTRVIYNLLTDRGLSVTGGGGTMLAFLGHEFIMIPIIRVYLQCGIWGFPLCCVTSILVTYILTRKVLIDFFSPILDFSVLCQRLRINVYNEKEF